MSTTKIERAPAIVPAPPGTQLLMLGHDGSLLYDFVTVVAFVVDQDHEIIEVVTTTSDKLVPDDYSYRGALVIGGRVVSPDRTEYDSLEAFRRDLRARRGRAQQATTVGATPAGAHSTSAQTPA